MLTKGHNIFATYTCDGKKPSKIVSYEIPDTTSKVYVKPGISVPRAMGIGILLRDDVDAAYKEAQESIFSKYTDGSSL